MDFHSLLNKAYESPGYQYNWICAICLRNANSGVLLEFQLLDDEHDIFVYFDNDKTPWLRCRRCLHKFHLSCVTCFTIEEQLATGDFVCCRH